MRKVRVSKIAFTFITLLIMAFFAGCGGGGGGGGGDGGPTTPEEKNPVARTGPDQTVFEDADVILDASGSTDDDGSIVAYNWLQTGGPSVTLSDTSAMQPTFTAPSVGPAGTILTFRLTVTDDEGLIGSASCSVTVKRSMRNVTGDVLYSAYAGIGYNRADITTDDEPLYGVLLDDLNFMTGEFVLVTIFNDPGVLGKLLAVVGGSTTTFTYTDSSGNASSIVVNPGADVNGFRSFEAVMSINFSPTGYAWSACQYYGSNGVDDLTANVTGYFKATIIPPSLDAFFLNSVKIEAKNTLRAVYPAPLGEVAYNQWKISYKAYYGEGDPTYTPGMSTYPVNMEIVPTIISEPLTAEDFRDYTLSGGFILNGDAYLFPANGIRYRQWQYDGQTLIALNGGLVPPGLTSTITVSSPDDTVNPLASGTIVRSLAGIWTSGIMYISGISSASQVVFNSNGSCLFSGGDQGDWTVLSWQNALEP